VTLAMVPAVVSTSRSTSAEAAIGNQVLVSSAATAVVDGSALGPSVPGPVESAVPVPLPVSDANAPSPANVVVADSWSGSVPASDAGPVVQVPVTEAPPVIRGVKDYSGATGFVDGESVQVGGSSTSLLYANPDGTTTEMEFAEPSLVQDPKTGTWQQFDGTPVLDAKGSGRLVPAAVGVDVSLSQSASDASLVSVGLGSDMSVGFSMEGAVDHPARVDGRKVVYSDVQPGVDLVEYPLRDGVKEEVVLRVQPKDVPVFRFPLTTVGVSPQVAKDDTIELVDGKGTIVSEIPAGFGWDSNPDLSEEQRRVPVATALVGKPGAWVVELRPDGAWLSDPKTVFPVTIDPTFVVPQQNASGDAYVVNSVPFGGYDGAAQWSSALGFYINQTGWSKPSASSPWNEYRSFYQFATPTLGACTFVSSNFVVDPAYQRAFTDTGGISNVSPLLYDVYQVTGAWAPSTLTWNGQPSATALYSANGQVTGNWAPFDVTSTVGGWINGSTPNYGFRLDVDYFDGWPNRNAGHAAIISLEQGAFLPHLDTTCRPQAFPTGPAEGVQAHHPAGTLLHFTWSDSAPSSNYALQVCYDTAWVACNYYYTGALSYDVPVTSLTQNSLIYWRVLRSDEATTWVPGPSSWILLPNTLPTSPTLNNAGPDGFVTTSTPTLTISGSTDSDPGDQPLVQYFYRACDQPNQAGNCKDSVSYISALSWTVPINWTTKYYWTVYAWDGLPTGTVNGAGKTVTAVSPSLGSVWAMGDFPNGAPSGVIDTASGNVHFTDSDIDPATIGTDIGINRAYNSVDTAIHAFGRGWVFPLDMEVDKSLNAQGQEVGVSVIMPDGRLEFHGKNADGSYALKAFGYNNDLTYNTGTAVYTLTDSAKTVFTFANTDGATSPNTYEITGFTDVDGHQTSIGGTASARTLRDVASGRQLTLNYTTPVGASRAHVTSVVSDPVGGSALTWTYSYTGDRLDQACSPDIDPSATLKTLCTVYRYDASTLAINKVESPQVKNGSPTNAKVRFEIVYTNGLPSAQKNGVANTWAYAYPNLPADLTIPVPPGTTGWPTSSTVHTKVTDPAGNVNDYYFDSQRRLLYKHDPAGGESWFAWDDHGFLKSTIQRLNDGSPYPDGTTRLAFATTLFTNDDKGRVTARTDADGSTWSWTYNDSNKVLTETDPFSNITTNTYDTTTGANQGPHLQTETKPATTDHSAPVTTYTYTVASTPAIDGTASDHPPLWLVASETDPRGKITTYGYNKAGDLRRVTDPVGLITEYIYDELGRKTTEAMNYNGNLGVTATITYDAVSRVTRVDNADVVNPVTSEHHQMRTSTTYDDNGHPLTVVLSDIAGSAHPDASRTTTYHYDDADRQDQVTALTNTITRVFDAVGRVFQVTDQRGSVLQTSYDSRNLPTSTTLLNFIDDPITPGTPRNVVLSQTGYDLAGRATAATDALGRVTTTDYDPMGRPTISQLYHNAASLAAAPRTPLEVLSTHSYTHGQLTKSTAFGIMVAGPPDQANQSQVIDYTHDTLGRVKTQTTHNTASNGSGGGTTDQVVTNTYDADGNIVKVLTAGGATTSEIRTKYDDANRAILNITENGATDIGTAVVRDKRGLVTTSTNPRGVSLDASDNPTINTAFNTTNTYDVLGQLTQTNSPAVDKTLADRTTGTSTTTVAQVPTVFTGYTTFGEVASVKDPNANVTTTRYNVLGQRDLITYPGYTPPGGSLITPTEAFTYDAAGNLKTRTDRRSQITSWDYDMRNRVVRQSDPTVGTLPAGVTRTVYNDSNTKSAITNPVGAVTQWLYDDLDRVTQQIVKVRNTPNPTTDSITTYGYDYQGDITSQCLPQVGTQTRCSSATFAPFGQPLTSTAPLGQIQRFGYDGLARPTIAVDPLGRTTTKTFDPANRLTAVDRAFSGTTLSSETYGYDAAGDQTSVTRPDGTAWNDTYDNLNRLATVTQPATLPMIAFWRLNTSVGGAVDSSGNAFQGTLSSTGVTRNQPPAPAGVGNIASYAFSGGNVSIPPSTVNGSGKTFSLWFKTTGNGVLLSKNAEPSGTATSSSHNPLLWVGTDGKLWARDWPAGYMTSTATVNNGAWHQAVLTVDANTQILYLDGAQVSSSSGAVDDSWGADNNYIGTGQTLGGWPATTGGWMPFQGQIDEVGVYNQVLVPAQVNIQAPQQIQNSYGYDLASNATKTVDGKGNSWLTTYNTWNLVQDRIEPSTIANPALADRMYTNFYDAGGLATRQDQAGAVRIDRAFDNAGNLTSETSVATADASAGTRTFTYDQIGRVATFGHPTSPATLTWDDRNLLKAVSGPAALNSSFVYDAGGRMTQRVDSAGTTNYTWDADDRLDLETDPLTTKTRDYNWFDDNQVQSVIYGPSGASASQAYTYDNLGRLSTDTIKNPSGTALRTVSYAYNQNGNVGSKIITGGAGAGSWGFYYDASERLVTQQDPSNATINYQWDANGNRIQAGTVAATYDQRNRLLTNGTDTYAWTARGTMKTKVVGGVATNSTFDGLGRMTGNGAVTYTYDALDRIAARTNGTTDTFSYSGQDRDPTRDGTATTSNLIAHSPSGDSIAVKVGTGAAQVIGQDRHGDLTSLFPTTATALTDSYNYDPFGGLTTHTGTTTNHVGFQTDYTDPTTALVDMGARWYAPTVDDFVSRDSYGGVLKSPISLNRYTYANNNPLAYFDPDGHCAMRIDGMYCVDSRTKPKPGPKPNVRALLGHDPGTPHTSRITSHLTSSDTEHRGMVNSASVSPERPLTLINSTPPHPLWADPRKNIAAMGPQTPLAEINVRPEHDPCTGITYMGDDLGMAPCTSGGVAGGHAPGGSVLDVGCGGPGADASCKTTIPGSIADISTKSGSSARTPTGETKPASEEGPSFYRGAKPGEAPSFEPRPNDFKVDPATGTVKPTHGVSVFDNPGSVTSKGFVPHEVDLWSVPPELQIIQRGADPAHFEIMPQVGANVTPEQYKGLMCQIVCKS
jgi:RHS repeat-associated protein